MKRRMMLLVVVAAIMAVVTTLSASPTLAQKSVECRKSVGDQIVVFFITGADAVQGKGISCTPIDTDGPE